MDVFKIEDLTFTYPGRQIPALSNITLKVHKGDFITLCGRSGSGKTTLMRLLKPALAPHGIQSGRIAYAGADQEVEVGFVLQNPENQIVTDKVWHEMAFGPENLGWDSETIRMRVAEMVSYFGMQSWFHKEVKELSGGQKQLLNLAAVMVMNPRVLLLDEPTAQLDPIAAADFLDTVARLHREIGTTILITEHRLDYLLPLTERMVVLEKGRLIVDETPAKGTALLAEGRHVMFRSMPAVVQAYAKAREKGLPVGARAPLDIHQGRQWMESLLGDVPLRRRRMEDASSATKHRQDAIGDDMIAVEAKNIWVRYERHGQDVLKGLSCKVHAGECFAIVGGNGSGKSTLLKAVCGVKPPYRGRVRLFGRRALMLPQDPQSVFGCETVREELEEMTGDAADMQRMAEEMTLSTLLDAHPYDLSGGEQQRLALAKVLLGEPDIVLMDEPTKGMDNAFKDQVGAMIHRLTASGRTVILVSHDIEFCALYADRCAMMFDGVLTTSGTPRHLFAGNHFYTTACSRMSSGCFENAVLPEDIAELLAENLMPWEAAPEKGAACGMGAGREEKA